MVILTGKNSKPTSKWPKTKRFLDDVDFRISTFIFDTLLFFLVLYKVTPFDVYRKLKPVHRKKVIIQIVDTGKNSKSTSKWPRTERFWNRIKSLKQRLLKGKVKAVDTLPLKESPTEVGDEGTLKEVDSEQSPKTGGESPKTEDESPKSNDGHIIMSRKVMSSCYTIPNSLRCWILRKRLAKFWKFCCHSFLPL